MMILQDSLPIISQFKITAMFQVIDRVYENIFVILGELWKLLGGWQEYSELKLCKSECD